MSMIQMIIQMHVNIIVQVTIILILQRKNVYYVLDEKYMMRQMENVKRLVFKELNLNPLQLLMMMDMLLQ